MKCNEKENCKVEFGECERLHDMVEPLVEWFRENQRDLPWRKHVNAYRVSDFRDYAAADESGSC